MESRSQKIFTNKAITTATSLGGPLTAGILISKNYLIFGKSTAARHSLLIGILSTLLLFGVLLLLPESVSGKIPQLLIPGLYTIVVSILVEKLQGKDIREYIENDGEQASASLTVKYSLFSAILTGILIAILIFSTPEYEYYKSIDIKKDVVLYYNNEIKDSLSERIAHAIINSRFMDPSEGADLFLKHDKEFLRLIFVVPDTSLLHDSLVIKGFNDLEKYLNYNINPVEGIEIGFTDTNMISDIDLIEPVDIPIDVYEPLLYLQSYHINDFQIIFYNDIMPISDVQKLENAVRKLKSYFPGDERIDIIFQNNGEDYSIMFFVRKEFWSSSRTINNLRITVDYLKDYGIEKNINLVLIDYKTNEKFIL